MKSLLGMQDTTPPGGLLQEGKSVAVLLLSGHSRAASELPAGPIAGFELRFEYAGCDGPLPPGIFSGGRAIIAEVEADNEASWLRLEHIISLSQSVPIAAAIANPGHAEMRRCLRLGACDVLPLPLSADELATALEHMGRCIGMFAPRTRTKGRIVAFAKSVGGAGATALLTQAGCLLAQRERGSGRQVCLLDLDIQFGSAALYLGLAPALSFNDLLAAGDRADEALLSDVTASHASGLKVIAAPPAIRRLDIVTAGQINSLLDVAVREFSTVLIDLPGAWTEWGLSTALRADAVCLVTELSVPGLRHARRQIDLLQQSGLGKSALYVLANRVQRSLWKPISLTAAEQALGHRISFVIGNDFRTVSAAIDQGVQLRDIRPDSRVERDLAAMLEQLLPPEA